MKFVSKNQGGFTLLELLVVVGIIAIIGGAMIASFSGQETKAARGVATNAIAGVENAMRIYKVATAGSLPNNMESLVCAPYSATGVVSTATVLADSDTNNELGFIPADSTVSMTTASAFAHKFGGATNATGIGGGMTKKLAEKFLMANLSKDQADALNDAGVTSMRYAMIEACDADATTIATVTAYGIEDKPMGGNTKSLVGIDIPNQAFEDPRPDGDSGFKHRSIGFSGVITTASPVLIWNRGQEGYNNVKVGAGADDVLIAMGLGQSSSLVGTGGDAAFGKAPFYGQVGKDKYAHYIALVNVGAIGSEFESGEAHVAAVVDARGDFLDEEIAEFQGQKI